MSERAPSSSTLVGRSKKGEIFSVKKSSAGTMHIASAESFAKAVKSASSVIKQKSRSLRPR